MALRAARIRAIRSATPLGPWALGTALLLLPGSAWVSGEVPVPLASAQEAHRECATCHRPHGGPSRLALLRSREPDALCTSCHQGQAVPLPGQGPVQIPEWQGQASNHLFQEAAQGSLAGRSYVRLYEAGTHRRALLAGCTGCHDPHGKEPGKLRDAAFDSRGSWVGSKPARVAQICFGCHAGPEAVRLSGAPVAGGDLGATFAAAAFSKHGMGRAAKERADLPSLNGTPHPEPLDCTSCHDNSDPNGPRGPHVSANPHLLVAPFARESETGFGPRSNDLCYRCHSQVSVEGDQSFPFHRAHILGFVGGASGGATHPFRPGDAGVSDPRVRTARDLRPGRQPGALAGFGQPTPCATCHDPHGSTRNPALIEFDTAVVSPTAGGPVTFQRTAPGHGTCTLACHGYSHVNTAY